MEMTERIPELIFKELRSEITEVEARELQEWVASSEEHRAFYEKFVSNERLHAEILEFYEFKENVRVKIGREIPEMRTRVVPMFPRRVWFYAAAAAVLIVFVMGVDYWLMSHRVKSPATEVQHVAGAMQQDVLPGGNKAVLTLGDGSSIVLDSAHNGALVQQGGTKITKLDSGRLAYNALREEPSEIVYNTLATPRGGQYQLVLPDGTKVWLNAASSLRYPTSFTGKERLVELKGEAYFEVAKNTARPFRVRVDDMKIDVLGTSFDVMAYADEQTRKATLLDGAIKVSNDHASLLLHPGEQAASENTGLALVKQADVEEAVAWKNGLFKFNGAGIEAVMRQISRWYDVDVIYQGPKTTHSFSGVIGRDTNLSNVLKILEYSGVHFKIDHNTVTVLPS
jgi:ferric-dicitrate binding protein FerR (iron transport regulator)